MDLADGVSDLNWGIEMGKELMLSAMIAQNSVSSIEKSSRRELEEERIDRKWKAIHVAIESSRLDLLLFHIARLTEMNSDCFSNFCKSN